MPGALWYYSHNDMWKQKKCVIIMTHKIVGKRDILGKVSNFFLINCL